MSTLFNMRFAFALLEAVEMQAFSLKLANMGRVHDTRPGPIPEVLTLTETDTGKVHRFSIPHHLRRRRRG